jgi:hypothetical protein
MGVMKQALNSIQSKSTKEIVLCNDTLAEEKVIIQFILKRQVVSIWICFMWHRVITNIGIMYKNNEISDSTNGRKFIAFLRHY